jgi:cytochrome c5
MTKVRTPNLNFPRYSVLIAFLALMVGIGILAAPSKGHAQNGTAANFNGAISVRPPVHGMSAFPARALYAAANQDASQGAAPPAASSQPNLVEMPDGDGKAIAVASCQTCHKLTNLTRAHKSVDDWRNTVRTEMDRGANVPQDKVETLVQYLAKNFGPKSDTPAPDAQAASSPSAPSADVPPSAQAQAKPVELPDGDGKEIALASCQLCHKLTNLIRAHKSPDEWRETVQTMMDRGAQVPEDKVEMLLQYLAKNFGPKANTPDSGAPAAGGPSTSSPQP